MIFLQFGYLPVVPDGHTGLVTVLQFGYLPVVPDGHTGLVTVLQFGYVPEVPDGQTGLVIPPEHDWPFHLWPSGQQP